MPDTIKARNDRLPIDHAFQYAVTVAWEDLATNVSRSLHLEYLYEPGIGIDHLTLWSVRDRGYQDLLCDYWTATSPAHPSGAHFENEHRSPKLVRSLDFIMKNQALFTRPADACPEGLVQIHLPDARDRADAAAWVTTIEGLESKRGVAEASGRPNEVSSEGHPQEHAATLPDATGYSQ